jgi:hypothetical protein
MGGLAVSACGDEVKWALASLDQACARCAAAMSAADDAGTFAAVNEALMWITALDDAHERRVGNAKEKYKTARNGDPDGAVVSGLRWARGRGLHQLAILLTRHSGPTALPWEPFGRLQWGFRAFARGPSQPAKHKKPVLEEVYDKAVRGRPVLDPIRRAQRWLGERAVALFPPKVTP